MGANKKKEKRKEIRKEKKPDERKKAGDVICPLTDFLDFFFKRISLDVTGRYMDGPQ